MKIVGTDNLARETVADHLWLDDIPDVHAAHMLATRVCDKLNERLGDEAGTFYQLKPDDYRLSRGMADIVGEPDEMDARGSHRSGHEFDGPEDNNDGG